MEYTIKAIETKFKSFIFRSRLEAKWAAMFEQLGWNWDYEPIDFNGWIPDFVIYGCKPVYVEVKPVIEFPLDIADELNRSGCKDEMLIVGQSCLIKVGEYTECSLSDPDGLCFGWINDRCDLDAKQTKGAWGGDWEQATFGRWSKGKGSIGFCHTMNSYHDRITGGYDGGSFGRSEVTAKEIKRMWANAHNLTRWMKT